MAEIVKAKKREELIDFSKEEEKVETKKENKKTSKKPKKEEEKKGLWTKFMIFCNGVKQEALKVRWTSKKDMIKYSVATIVFVIFCSLFFYMIDAVFALVQSLFD